MKNDCKPEDIKIKACFLGAKAENNTWFENELKNILDHWYSWRISKTPEMDMFISNKDKDEILFNDQVNLIKASLNTLLNRLKMETPTFSPKYIGHMTSEVTIPSLLGHFSCLLHNPNTTSKEVSREVSIIEEEVISQLANMVGYDNNICQGHVCSGGTVANFEAVWRARFRLDHWLALGCYLNLHSSVKLSILESAYMGWDNYDRLFKQFNIDEEALKQYSFVLRGPWEIKSKFDKAFGLNFTGPVLIVPKNMHFSWKKSASLFGLGHNSIITVDLDEFGRMDISSLESALKRLKFEQIPIMMAVGVMGTTELGVFDPLDDFDKIFSSYRKKYGWHIWTHIDAAYGGYYSIFKECKEQLLSEQTLSILKSISKYDSITLDPHKLGLGLPKNTGHFL